MSTLIRTYRTIGDAGLDRWDALARACGAPVFYSTAFLGAFERFPLHPLRERYYIAGEDGQGALIFALPAYLLQQVDPMKVLATHAPDAARAPILLSHVWHCYDTWLLGTPLDDTAWRTALEAMQGVACEAGAAYWGFANVEADGPLARGLDAAGLVGQDADEHFVTALAPTPTVAAYLAGLHRSARGNVTRYRAIADRAGVRTTVRDATESTLDGFVALARANAAKYDNADFYRPGLFQAFVHALGPQARVVEHELDGRLIGAAILLVDDVRLHFWAAGSDYEALPQASPFYLSFLAAIETALAAGKACLEAGRRNPQFKTRYGLQRRALRLYLQPTADSLHRYR